MEINDLNLHDSILAKVEENCDSDTLIFHIKYPEDWENNKFINAKLIFENMIGYEIHEGPFSGCPTILEIKKEGNREDFQFKRDKVVLETNAGYRILYCSDIHLKKD
jgi:hypothetical protein